MRFSLDQLSGQKLGQYELVELLGVGGMGAVYRGHQISLQRDVAVKLLFTPHTYSEQDEKRFLREARMAASLEHAHIVPIHDFGTDQGISYVVMRLLGGQSLADRVHYNQEPRLPYLPLREVADITSDLASALQYAHDRNIIHRDIKASNVMFDDQGTVFLVDFGIAKMAGNTTSLTGTGFKVGTPNFMAPEQWRNDPLSPALDQYALAILVYQMLCGEFPFQGDEPYHLMNSHLNSPPLPLSLYRGDIAADLLMDVINRALSKRPEERYADVTDFAQAFEDAIEMSPENSTVDLGFAIARQEMATPVLLAPEPQAQPQAQAPAARSWKRYGLALLGVLLLAVAGVALVLSGNGPVDGGIALADGGTASTMTALAANETAQAVALAALPSETSTATATETTAPTATATDTAEPTATNTDTPPPTATTTDTPSPTATSTQEPTATHTDTPSPTATTTDSPSPTAQTVAQAIETASFILPLAAMETGDVEFVNMAIECPEERCYTLDITIHFDPEIVQIEGVDPSTSMFEPILTADNRIDNEAGVLRLIANAVDPEVLATQQALLAATESATGTPTPDERVFALRVSAVSPGTSPLQVANLYVFDHDGQSMRAISTDGGIFVTGDALGSSQATCSYRVQVGDTLSGIAAANGVSVAQITELNDIPNQSVIRVGQTLTVPAANCRAPAQAHSSSAGSTQTFEVYDCRNLGGNIFEWYSAEVTYDQAGNASSVTRTGGPYSGAWQPGCPAPNQNSSSSSNNSSNNTSNSGNNSGGGGSTTPPEESDDGGGGGEEGGGGGGGLGGLVCGLLGC